MERGHILPTIEAAGTPRKRCERESCRERPRLKWEKRSFPTTPSADCPRWHLCISTQQHHQPPVAQACPLTVGEIYAPPLLGQNQQQVPGQSIQASNANISSVKDMFKLVTIVFHQIMTELNGARSEVRIVGITKFVLNLN
jgi:hypothetical protein